MLGFSKEELSVLKKLTTPEKIQDFLETIPINFEVEGNTLLSPRRVLKERKAHCFEGALLAAATLAVHGERPIIMDLRTADGDEDHVIALFQRFGCYGAITKTNHAVLRYREPVYKTLRELVLSFFHEYFLDDCMPQHQLLRYCSCKIKNQFFNSFAHAPACKYSRYSKSQWNAFLKRNNWCGGRKMLREYSQPLDLSAKRFSGWAVDEKEPWYIDDALNEGRFFPILGPAQVKTLRRADPIEIRAGKLTEWSQMGH